MSHPITCLSGEIRIFWFDSTIINFWKPFWISKISKSPKYMRWKGKQWDIEKQNEILLSDIFTFLHMNIEHLLIIWHVHCSVEWVILRWFFQITLLQQGWMHVTLRNLVAIYHKVKQHSDHKKWKCLAPKTYDLWWPFHPSHYIPHVHI